MPRFDHTAAIEELQTFRATNERRSERVAALGACLIRDKYIAKLGDQGTYLTTMAFVSAESDTIYDSLASI